MLVTSALSAAPAPRPAPRPPAPPVDRVAPGRPERIGNWLHRLQKSTLENLRGGSAAYAGQVTGMVIGAAIFTPIAVSTANMYVLTGGSALVGGLGAIGAYYLERALTRRRGSQEPSQLADGALALGAAMKAVPRFVYPSLVGASPVDRELIMQSLDRLPMGSVTSASTLHVLPGLEKSGALGVAHPLFSQTRVLLDREALGWYGGFNHELVSHEMGHARDFVRGMGPFGAHSLIGPFGKGPYVTEYAGTNRFEDFAETHSQYHLDRAGLQRATPEKFQVMDDLHRQGLGERWAEQPGVRQAGRDAGRALESVPYLRNGLELALALVAPIQVHRGAVSLEQGLQHDDPARTLHGKMTLASGLLLFNPGWAPAALATSLTHLTVSRLAAEGHMSMAAANRVGDGVLAASAGPLGMVGSAIGAELAAEGVELASREPFLQGPETGHLGGLLSVVGGSSAGLFVGATVGHMVGGIGGMMVGSFWGPVTGAALGLGGYHLLKGRAESAPSDLDLTTSDKVFLAKVIGGAVVLGGGGTVLGGMLGRMAGAAIGGAVLGPAGAVTGEFVGRAAGMLVGAYAGGRAGAWAGRKLD